MRDLISTSSNFATQSRILFSRSISARWVSVVSAVLLEGVGLVALGGVAVEVVAAVGVMVSAWGGVALAVLRGVWLVAMAIPSAGAGATGGALSSSGWAIVEGGTGGALLTAATRLPLAWSGAGSVFVVGRAFCWRSIDAAFWVGFISTFTPPTEGTGQCT